MPAIDPGLGGAGNCQNVAGSFRVRFPSVACAEVAGATTTFTYNVYPMTAVSATPTQLNQSGGPAGSPITGLPSTITVVGTNFVDPTTVEIYGGNGANIPVNNAVVANGTQLSFTAPAVLNTHLNSQPCVPTGGTSVTGTRYVPTSFGIRLRNARTGCTVDLPNILIYNPADTVCRAPITFAGAAAPTATLCTAYGPVQFNAAGGVGPYNITVSGLPNGVTYAPNGALGIVTISGTPALLASGPGVASQNYTVSISATDASTPAMTGSTSYTLVLNDPNAPFTVTAAATTLNATAVGSVNTSITSSAAGLGAVSYTGTVPSPALPPEVTFGVSAGGVATLTRSAAGAGGSSTVTVTMADTGCGGTRHQGSVTLTLDY
jgi:hypothetical protein